MNKLQANHNSQITKKQAPRSGFLLIVYCLFFGIYHLFIISEHASILHEPKESSKSKLKFLTFDEGHS